MQERLTVRIDIELRPEDTLQSNLDRRSRTLLVVDMPGVKVNTTLLKSGKGRIDVMQDVQVRYQLK